jgi:hypothetical protein
MTLLNFCSSYLNLKLTHIVFVNTKNHVFWTYLQLGRSKIQHGFEQALQLWRPLLANDGIAIVSEMSWFTNEVPDPAIAYWHKAYPMIGSEAENIDRANRAGFSVLSTQKLPSSAWWINYYNPLRERMKKIEITPVTQSVIRETEEQMLLFEKFSNSYGYMFYVLRAI